MSAPAARAFSAFSPWAKTATRTALADAVRQRHRAAHVLIGLLGVDSQVGRDLDRLVELGRVEALQEPDGLGQRDRARRLELLVSTREIASNAEPKLTLLSIGSCRQCSVRSRRAVAPGSLASEIQVERRVEPSCGP